MEECVSICDTLPRCGRLYNWTSSFNNSCFGGPEFFEADNGVCNDGGPGANSDICAFGTLCAGSI